VELLFEAIERGFAFTGEALELMEGRDLVRARRRRARRPSALAPKLSRAK
jgi:hypothetical protein